LGQKLEARTTIHSHRTICYLSMERDVWLLENFNLNLLVSSVKVRDWWVAN